MKRIIILLILFLKFAPSFGQRFVISANVGGEAQGLLFQANDQISTNGKMIGSNTLSLFEGYKGGVHLNYFFGDNSKEYMEFGLGIGADVHSFKTNMKMNFVETSDIPIVYNTIEYYPRTYFENLTEEQDFLQYSFPLGLYFHKPCNGQKMFWLFGFGVQFDYLKGKFKTGEGYIETRLYEPFDNVEFSNIPRYHLDRYNNTFSGEYTDKIVYSGFVTLGLFFNVVGNFDIGLNLNGAYSIVPLLETAQQDIFQQTKVSDMANEFIGEYRSVWNSKMITQAPRLMTIGISLELRIRIQ